MPRHAATLIVHFLFATLVLLRDSDVGMVRLSIAPLPLAPPCCCSGPASAPPPAICTPRGCAGAAVCCRRRRRRPLKPVLPDPPSPPPHPARAMALLRTELSPDEMDRLDRYIERIIEEVCDGGGVAVGHWHSTVSRPLSGQVGGLASRINASVCVPLRAYGRALCAPVPSAGLILKPAAACNRQPPTTNLLQEGDDDFVSLTPPMLDAAVRGLGLDGGRARRLTDALRAATGGDASGMPPSAVRALAGAVPRAAAGPLIERLLREEARLERTNPLPGL